MTEEEEDTALISYAHLKELQMDKSGGDGVNWVTLPHEEVPIRMSMDPTNPASQPPQTVMHGLDMTARQYPTRPALAVKRDGRWQTWTYAAYRQECRQFAKAVMHFGVERFQGVSIIGFNSPEWVIANLGAIYASCLPAGIYTTNGAEACHYVAQHSGAAIVVVENALQCKKFLEIRDRLPALKVIVQWSGPLEYKVDGLYDWKTFLSHGDRVEDEKLDARMALTKPGNCCTLIYTSGTTGQPKAVMLSHDNITWTARQGVKTLFGDIDPSEDPQRIVSYLPLSHVAAQLVDIHAPILMASTTYFAQPDAMKGSLVQTLSEVHPTQFLGVPRVWEKIEEKMRATGAAGSNMKQRIGTWAKKIGLEGSYAKMNNKSLPWGWHIAEKLVYANVKKALGLDQCQLSFTAAAPISMKTMEYFMSLDNPLYEVYGMSECSGPHTVNIKEKCKVGTVGFPMDGVELKLFDQDKKGHGEICMRGRHVFMGYLHNPKATQDTLDTEGWLHSGDIGAVDADGFLSITGRIKELIITAGGENVAPVLIEDIVKEECQAISNAMVIGDQRKYLTCLLTLKSETNPDNEPTIHPAGPTMSFLQEVGSPATTIPEAVRCPHVQQALKDVMGRVNARVISRAQMLRKWSILPGDFTVEGGELTPTMKLKRRAVMAKHASVIEDMYPPETAELLAARL